MSTFNVDPWCVCVCGCRFLGIVGGRGDIAAMAGPVCVDGLTRF